MLDISILETIFSTADSTLTLGTTLSIIASSIILGLLISVLYQKTNKRSGSNSNFPITLIMLPVIISIIILLVGNNIARAFSLAGVFSIIRFRSAPGDPKDISYIFFTLAVGLACGMGYIGYAVLFTAILGILMLALYKGRFAAAKESPMELKITVPEDLNYEDAFTEILDRYNESWALEKIKTRDFGALFELTYRIYTKENSDKKKFIDELRCRNGNLNISLTLTGFEDKGYYY